MQLTPNYNLKKPEETDPIDILDLNDNADIIDAEFKKRPVASGGDVSDMTVKTLETITTEFPVPVAGESTKTFLGKVKKFFEDTKNWMTGVCLVGQIVNNCVTDRPDLPGSAAQLKVLMDLYTVLNTKISVLDDITYFPVTAFENRVDSIKGGYICIGKLVIVSVQCKIKTTLINASETGTSSAVIIGLPLPDFAVSLSVTKHTGGTNRQSENGNIDINGAVAVQHDQLASFSAGSLISISGAYFAK